MAPTCILITGANSGIGYAISKVLALASDDFHIVMTGRSLPKLEAAKSSIEALPFKGRLSTVQLDVTDPTSISTALSQISQQHTHIDVLINNAGVGAIHESDTKKRYEMCFATNVIGPALVAEAFRPLLLKSKNPYSIYVGSGARTWVRNALQRPPSHGRIQNGDAYQVSKAALNMVAVLEMRDYGSREEGEGVKVFVVSPGFVGSNLRGPGEEAISGWGEAGDADESGHLLLSIVRGERDADVGRLVHKDGVFPW